jgi:DNA-binding transcriptional regulator YiaG
MSRKLEDRQEEMRARMGLPVKLRPRPRPRQRDTQIFPGAAMQPKELRQIRQQLGLSQGRFARLLGTSQNTLSRWECGGQRISSIVAMAVRHAVCLHKEGA